VASFQRLKSGIPLTILASLFTAKKPQKTTHNAPFFSKSPGKTSISQF